VKFQLAQEFVIGTASSVDRDPLVAAVGAQKLLGISGSITVASEALHANILPTPLQVNFVAGIRIAFDETAHRGVRQPQHRSGLSVILGHNGPQLTAAGNLDRRSQERFKPERQGRGIK
jgi:hypothetical protein